MPVDARVVSVTDASVKFVTLKGKGLQAEQVFDAFLVYGPGRSQSLKGIADTNGNFIVHFAINNNDPSNPGNPINPVRFSGFVRAGTLVIDFGAKALS